MRKLGRRNLRNKYVKVKFYKMKEEIKDPFSQIFTPVVPSTSAVGNEKLSWGTTSTTQASITNNEEGLFTINNEKDLTATEWKDSSEIINERLKKTEKFMDSLNRDYETKHSLQLGHFLYNG